MMNDEIKANDIVRRLCRNGWEAYIAGGAARDILNNETPSDYDVVTNASYDDVKKLFKFHKLSIVGASFKVCIIDGIEVATYRKNPCFDLSDKNCTIEKADTIQEDLAHRDLTINAMAFCPYNGDIVDEYGGLADLKNRIIKFTGNPKDRIHEDPCRILRACRFLAKLEGKFDADTLHELKKNSHLVEKEVAPERIRTEILKSLQYSKPSLFFDALYNINALNFISPGFFACHGHDGGPYHGETIDTHIKLVGDHLPARKPLLRLAGYFHDHGKPAAAVYKDNKLSFLNHARISADMVEEELKALKFSIKETAYVKALTKHHMRNITGTDKPKTVRKALKAFQDDGVDWKDWLQLKIADTKGNLKKKNKNKEQVRNIVLSIYNELHPPSHSAVLSIGNLAIDGEDVMKTLKIDAGPKVGQVLKKALDYVIEDPERNTYHDLTQFIKLNQKGKRPWPAFRL